MNKFIIVALIASMACVVFADSEDAHAYIIKQNSNIDEHGQYQYNYETSNHISAEEKGEGAHYAKGSYSYKSPEGESIKLDYLADENGFHPVGSHLPVGPEIPHAILKSLEYIRTHPQPEEKYH